MGFDAGQHCGCRAVCSSMVTTSTFLIALRMLGNVRCSEMPEMLVWLYGSEAS